ncbi:tetratricopeptide repeat protein [Azoarcus sp. L1K30]|uniref:O-linked N-acetylglucosamine transferase, SPINDLY family protein n=1 Tax=Azoarcus sp. L1K30 TaxID=2820277 RepID=UPI001B81F473|nr:tetratricopeptide repeat protein [Azoarcus sp. L1K30]MBR0565935.1 tetratricopeptide repeat protein [Azoarcus sp. L1K30]
MTQAMVDDRALADAFRHAVGAHQANRLEEAKLAYRSILQRWPLHPGSNHNLGLLLLGTGGREAGLALLQAAFEADPEGVQFGLSYIDALLHFGAIDRADIAMAMAKARGYADELLRPRVARMDALRAGVHAVPGEDDSHRLIELFNAARFGELETYALELTVRYPQFAPAWKALGLSLHAQGKLEDAANALQRGLELTPEDAEGHNNLGVVFQALGWWQEAERCYRMAARVQPGFAGAHRNLGLMLRDHARHAEAEACFRTLIGLAPDDAVAQSNLGLVFAMQGRFPEAEVCYRKALALRPDFAECLSLLAHVHKEMGRLDVAESGFRQALKLDPSLAGAVEGLGSLSLASGDPKAAIQLFRQAVEMNPDRLDTLSCLLFALNYSSAEQSETALQEASRYGARLSAGVARVYRDWPLDPEPARLRVGFVSGDLRQHPVGYFLEGILPVLDRARLELIAYSTQSESDVLTEQLKSSFSAWHSLAGLDDDAAATRIRADGVHVLIDLSGHTAHNRLGVFVRKAAPVQVSWPGYFATTGVPGMDWFIADRTTVPEPHQAFFSEKVWYLPETRLCFTPPVDAPQVAPLPMLGKAAPTFGCFQNLTKVTDEVLRLWAKVLDAVPGAGLRLQSHQLKDASGITRVRERLVACGIDPLRVTFHPPCRRREYLAAHAEVDFILDTFPYTGGTTTCEALWMGVPTLTLAGETLIARQGASIMEAAGLSGWIAESPQDYLDKAVALAADVDGLTKLRQGLRERLLRTTLFDTPRFARHLEDALWAMWRQAAPVAISTMEASAHVTPVPESAQSGAATAKEMQVLIDLFRQNRYEQLATEGEAFVSRHPGYGMAWKVLGIALKELGRNDDALHAMARSVVLLPEDVEARGNLGLMLFALGRFAEAADCHRQALMLDPADTESAINLVAALVEQDRLDEAIDALRQAVAGSPRHFELNFRLAELLRKEGQLAEAEHCFSMAAELEPKRVDVHFRLGTVLYELRRLDEAEKCLRYVLSLDPDHASAMGNLGLVYYARSRYAEAEKWIRQALVLQPEAALLHSNLGSALLLQGRLSDALESYRTTLALRPDWTHVHSNLLFSLNFAAEDDPQALLSEALAYGERVAVPDALRYREWNVTASPVRLKVGFVSGDLRQHPVGYFLEGILPVLDRSRLELIAYPTSNENDVLSEQLKSSFAAWHPLVGMDDDAAAARIHADGIHVLIDLSGHTAHNRLPVFARRPAPVQLSWPGYFATTGVAGMDWFVADRTTVPESHQRYFSERVWYLPDTRLCFTPPVDAPNVSPLPMLNGQGPTFGCFQNLTKVTDEVLRTWAQVLEAVPGAQLRLQCRQLSDAEGVMHVSERLTACGIDVARVGFHRACDRLGYLAAYAEVDFVLDTFPYTGGTTTCEALWMGAPTLTLTGDTLIARQGASIMQAAGLPEWVVDSPRSYVDRAAALAADVAALARLRAGMRERLVRTALFDTPLFARHLEDAFWAMWQQFQSGNH